MFHYKELSALCCNRIYTSLITHLKIRILVVIYVAQIYLKLTIHTKVNERHIWSSRLPTQTPIFSRSTLNVPLEEPWGRPQQKREVQPSTRYLNLGIMRMCGVVVGGGGGLSLRYKDLNIHENLLYRPTNLVGIGQF